MQRFIVNIFLDEGEFVGDNFSCKNVKFQIRPKTINHILSLKRLDRDKKIKNLKLIGRVSQNLNKRKRRYTNPNNYCKLCNEEIPREQKSHLLQHCSAISATPAVRGEKIDLRATARRCLAIVCAEKSTIPTTPKKRKFGEGDGESIAEMTPKKKRRRPIYQVDT